MPEGTEREKNERQGQNWTSGKNIFPDFPMKIEIAPFVFTNHCLSMNIYLFFKYGVPSILKPIKIFESAREASLPIFPSIIKPKLQLPEKI